MLYGSPLDAQIEADFCRFLRGEVQFCDIGDYLLSFGEGVQIGRSGATCRRRIKRDGQFVFRVSDSR
jgi:hypothetical protein